jgi:hypothetical protein
LIGFNLPEAAGATLTISSVDGKVLRVLHVDGVKGYNAVVLDRRALPAGVLQYTLRAGAHLASKRMILAE